MERVWQKIYPEGVPFEIDISDSDTIVTVLKRSAAQFTDQNCFTNMGKSLSFTEIDKLSSDFAAYLQDTLKLKKGDRIAIQMPNLLQYPIALFGALKAGLIVVNTNPLYTPREMEHQFRDADVKAIVILENFASNLEEVLKNYDVPHIIVTRIGDMLGLKGCLVNFVVKYIKKMVPSYRLEKTHSFSDALETGAESKLQPVELTGSDIAFLQYTGGTTGVSKGAMLTHTNVVSNMEQAATWISPLLKEGEEIIVTALPLYHIFSLTVNSLALMRIGGENLLVTNPKDIPGFIKLLKNNKFTVMTGVNTLFNALMNHKDFKSIDFSRVKVSVGGAMALQKSVVTRWKELTGSPLIEGYGLTEASPIVVCNPVDGTAKIGTIGLPVPSTDVCVVDENANPLPVGEEGELAAKGPQVMKGYWKRPDETAKVIKDGWLITGDMAVMEPDGFFKIVDRKKDMILVSGFNVYPNEIEGIAAAHPGVLEVAAIGAPDEKSGEVVKLVVVKKDPSLTEDQLIEHCRKELTNYKVPKMVEFREELPKTNVGKILRRALR